MLLAAVRVDTYRREGQMTIVEPTRNRRLTWLEPVPVIFAHDIASARIVGNDVSIVFYVEREMDGQIIGIPNLELIRPLVSCLRWTLRDILGDCMSAEQRVLLPVRQGPH